MKTEISTASDEKDFAELNSTNLNNASKINHDISNTIINRVLNYYKKNGLKQTIYKMRIKFYNYRIKRKFLKLLQISKQTADFQKNVVFDKTIKFSILVPLYNTPKKFLKQMIESVQKQTYSNWELCLADGSDKEHEYVGKYVNSLMKTESRIKYKLLENNLGISENTNVCIDMATGNYICLFDHDDVLHHSALYEYMCAISQNNADFIYCDELTFINKVSRPTIIHFKPDFAIDNLRANNYICHFSVFSKELLNKAGKFRKEFDGSQDHDMIFRLTEQAKMIYHIPKVLYYWRSHKNSVASDIGSKGYAIKSGISAVNSHLDRCGLKAEVESSRVSATIYRIRYNLIKESLVSIILFSEDNYINLQRCLNSIIDKTSYNNYEIIVCDNFIKNAYKDLISYINSNEKIKLVYANFGSECSLSTQINFCAGEANGEHLVFLESNTLVENQNWIEELLMYSQRSDVGAVGSKIYSEDNLIQTAGMILGLGKEKCVGNAFYRTSKENAGYMGRLSYSQNLSCVSKNCMMLKSSIFKSVGGFDNGLEREFLGEDLCLNLRKLNYNNVWTPYAEFYSIRQNISTNISKIINNNDVLYFKNKWRKVIDCGDKFYNPNLTLDKEDFTIK